VTETRTHAELATKVQNLVEISERRRVQAGPSESVPACIADIWASQASFDLFLLLAEVE